MSTFYTFLQPRWLLVFLLSAVADFVAAVHVFTLSHSMMAVTLASGFLLPFVNHLGAVWFVEAKSNTERLAITAYSAAGIVLGTSTALLLFDG